MGTLRLLKIKLKTTTVALFEVAVLSGSPAPCRRHLMHFLHLDVQVDGWAVKLWFRQLFLLLALLKNGLKRNSHR